MFTRPEPDRPASIEQRRIGYGAGVSNFFEVAAFASMNIFAGWIGGLAVAAWAIVLNVAAIVFMVPLGLAIYVPALGVLDRQGPPGLPAWLAWLAAPVAAAFVTAGGLAWRAGIHHYVGTGS